MRSVVIFLLCIAFAPSAVAESPAPNQETVKVVSAEEQVVSKPSNKDWYWKHKAKKKYVRSVPEIDGATAPLALSLLLVLLAYAREKKAA